jgi:hypothetical protein
MFDPKLKDPNPEASKTHPQKVFCEKRQHEAEVVIAYWPFSEEGWSDWRVIDCSLLPPGAVHCGMDCMSQIRLAETQKS